MSYVGERGQRSALLPDRSGLLRHRRLLPLLHLQIR